MIRTFLALFLLLVVAACGSDSEPRTEDTATPTETTATLPKCADVWKDGAALPATYSGCAPVEGETVGPVDTCENGTDKFATYVFKDTSDIETPYFALLGGKVIEYTDDEFGPYESAFTKCRAG